MEINYSFLAVALIIAFGLKELITLLEDGTKGFNRFICGLNVFACIVLLTSYERWLV